MRWGAGHARDAYPQDFNEWASTAAYRLRDTAFLMCRDWHLAEDLTQTALTKIYVAWPQVVRADNIDAYARKVLLRSLLDHRRRRATSEVLSDDVGAGALVSTADSVDLRLTLLDALATLSTRDRAVVVLRYWEDYSIAQVADLLTMSPSNVKKRSTRGLAALHAHLGELAVQL